MTRRIVQLAGAMAQFALADDGTIWLWTPNGWTDANRGPLPDRGPAVIQPEEPRVEYGFPTPFGPVRIVSNPAPPTTGPSELDIDYKQWPYEQSSQPKRGPGRPRKNP